MIVLEAILQVKKGKENAVIKKINENRRSFPKIRKVEKYNDNHVIVFYPEDYFLSEDAINQLQKKFQCLDNIVQVSINQPNKDFKKNISTKHCHFIFDVDSTLTTGRGTIQHKVRDIFNDMKDDGHRIYLASGRSMEQLRQDIMNFKTEQYGIAENGGILLGFGKDGYLVIGDRTNPDKISVYMKQKCKKIKEDIEQGMRLTEKIFKATVPEPTFLKYVKRSKIKVNVLASKNSYHVAQDKVNKGFALEKLKTKLRFGFSDLVIGIGDSGLDIPLLEESDYGFVVGNASQKAKGAGIVLGKSYADGVKEMYECWFKK